MNQAPQAHICPERNYSISTDDVRLLIQLLNGSRDELARAIAELQKAGAKVPPISSYIRNRYEYLIMYLTEISGLGVEGVIERQPDSRSTRSRGPRNHPQ